MEEIPLSELDPRLQQQVAHAKKATDSGNPAYAVPVCTEILKRFPGCYEVRALLRKAQTKGTGPAGGAKGLLGKVTRAPMFLGCLKRNKDPEQAMIQAEMLLAKDLGNVQAHRQLGEAAEALGLWNTAALAYEGIRAVDPDQASNLKALGQVYLKLGRHAAAIGVGERLMLLNPRDSAGQELVKHASVTHSIQSGGWESEGGFRSKLKDEQTVRELEQASRAQTDQSGLDQLLARAEAALEAWPDDVNLLKEIAGLYQKVGNWQAAIEWIGRARATPMGQVDVSLERLESDYRKSHYEGEVGRLRAAGTAEGTPQAEALEQAENDLREFRREEAERLVKRYPHEGTHRFDLGVLLLEDGLLNEAIAQFQQAVRHPKVRVMSLLNLGKAYRAKGFADMAGEQLTLAKAEYEEMDDLKKEIVYELGLAYEAAGSRELAAAEFKALYSVDLMYRDVADKVEQLYRQ